MTHKNKEKYNEYQREYQLKRYHDRRNSALVILGNKCVICKTDQNLEIDHKDCYNKSFSISKLWSCSIEQYLKELSKCQILCKKHHLEKSIQEGKISSYGGKNRIDNYTHGSSHMYNKDKCRCDLCREWKRKYRLKLVDTMGGAIDS